MERVVMKEKASWPWGWLVMRTNKHGIVVQTYESSSRDDAQKRADFMAKVYGVKVEYM